MKLMLLVLHSDLMNDEFKREVKHLSEIESLPLRAVIGRDEPKAIVCDRPFRSFRTGFPLMRKIKKGLEDEWVRKCLRMEIRVGDNDARTLRDFRPLGVYLMKVERQLAGAHEILRLAWRRTEPRRRS